MVDVCGGGVIVRCAYAVSIPMRIPPQLQQTTQALAAVCEKIQKWTEKKDGLKATVERVLKQLDHFNVTPCTTHSPSRVTRNIIHRLIHLSYSCQHPLRQRNRSTHETQFILHTHTRA